MIFRMENSANLVLSWDEVFMQMAHLMARRSKDPSTQAGSIIVDDSHVVLGLGYNGWPRGIENNDLPWEREGGFLDTKYAYVVHAEVNSIYNAHKDLRGATLYCTLFPCNECAKTIIQVGIKEIVFDCDKYHDNEVWVAARRLFDLAGVKYRQYVPEYKMGFEVNE